MKATLSLLSLTAFAVATHTTSAADWTTVGNSGTNPATNFIGTTDNKPLEMRVNNKRVWRAEPTDFSDSVNIIGGAASNSVANGIRGATIAGGGHLSRANIIDAGFATIGGGCGNWIEAHSGQGVIAGGQENNIQQDSPYSAILGGSNNDIGPRANHATVAGGLINKIGEGAYFAFIAGGIENRAKAPYTFAAGCEAIAAHKGSFVWADRRLNDSYMEPYSSQGPNEFRVRARGGVHLSNGTSLNFGNQARQMINLWAKDYGIGVQTNTLYQRSTYAFAWYKGGLHHDAYNNPGTGKTLMLLTPAGLTVNGTFVSTSDRNAKENFAPVDSADVLAKVAALPISRWSYKDDEQKSAHIGPMAQDFHAAFHLGEDDKHIATVDADGIALAAIQALHTQVKEKDARIAELEADARRTNERLARLEAKSANQQ
jgi:hypothetical protein